MHPAGWSFERIHALRRFGLHRGCWAGSLPPSGCPSRPHEGGRESTSPLPPAYRVETSGNWFCLGLDGQDSIGSVGPSKAGSDHKRSSYQIDPGYHGQ